MEFFSQLDPLLKSFWFIAIPVSLIFIIQAIMTFTGMDSTDGVSADFDSNLENTDAPFQLFSLRNLINFLLGFSWTGISFYTTLQNKVMLVGLSILVGAAFVGAFFLIIRQIQRLAEDNSFKIANALNQVATVYLTIPEKKSGKGKVQVSVKGSFHELDAITEHEKIETSAMVKIVRVEGSNLVVVQKI
jgi:membrane-bound ClpP family serine protease